MTALGGLPAAIPATGNGRTAVTTVAVARSPSAEPIHHR